MGLGLGSVVWDATEGWSCDEITLMLQAPAEARVIGYSTWRGCWSGDGWQRMAMAPIRLIQCKTEVGCR